MIKIHIDEKIYECKVGIYNIQIFCPDGRKEIISQNEVIAVGCDKSFWESHPSLKERGYLIWSDITPGILKQYIIEKGI